jgi:hypothetical protein
VFRASTELGAFSARRQIELRGNDNFQPQAAQSTRPGIER